MFKLSLCLVIILIENVDKIITWKHSIKSQNTDHIWFEIRDMFQIVCKKCLHFPQIHPFIGNGYWWIFTVPLFRLPSYIEQHCLKNEETFLKIENLDMFSHAKHCLLWSYCNWTDDNVNDWSKSITLKKYLFRFLCLFRFFSWIVKFRVISKVVCLNMAWIFKWPWCEFIYFSMVR